MNISIASVTAFSCLAASLASCGPPMAHSTMSSDTTSTNAAGGETHTTVSETHQDGANGSGTVRRTETTVQTTPSTAPAPAH